MGSPLLSVTASLSRCYCYCVFCRSVSGTPPCPLPPRWSTSPPRLWAVPGPWCASRASSSPSPTSPRRAPTTPLPPPRAWASSTRGPAAGDTAGGRGGSGGARPELPGTEGPGRADPGPTQAAGPCDGADPQQRSGCQVLPVSPPLPSVPQLE